MNLGDALMGLVTWILDIAYALLTLLGPPALGAFALIVAAVLLWQAL